MTETSPASARINWMKEYKARRPVDRQEEIPNDLQDHRKIGGPKNFAPAFQDNPVGQVGPSGTLFTMISPMTHPIIAPIHSEVFFSFIYYSPFQ
jgi:hypothetical protein